jgi:predicted acyl esterase
LISRYNFWEVAQKRLTENKSLMTKNSNKMKKCTTIISFVLIYFLVGVSTLQAQDNTLQELEEIAIVDQKIMMPMRDGIRLATDIYRPKTDEKVPIIFSRTPYNFNSWGDGEEKTRTAERALEAVKRGYA